MSESERRPFVVVVFPEDEDRLAVIPASWIIKEKGRLLCRWPTKSANVNKLARMYEDPTDDWDKIRVNIMQYSSSYASAISYKNKFSGTVETVDEEDTLKPEESLIISTTVTNLQETNNQLIRLEEKLDQICMTVEKLSQIVANNGEILRALSGVRGDNMNECFKRVSTFDELQRLEDQMTDVKQFSKLANLLAVLGGRNQYECTRRVLSSLISHDLAIKMSWKGSVEKRAVTEYPYVVKLVIAAVKRNKKYHHVTQYMIEDQIKRWFRYASDRNGGRLRRMKQLVASSSSS